MKSQQTASPKLYIGIDIHKRSWKIHCATDLSIGKTFSMSPAPKQLYAYVMNYYPNYQVSTAYEAGCCGYSSHRCFISYGWRSLDKLVFDYEAGNAVLKSRMRSFRFIDKEFKDVSTLLRKYTKQYYKKDYMLLRSIPGIGSIVASGILSKLGDLRRFNNIKHLAGYVSLSPGIYQSGDTLRHTGVSMRPYRLIRSYFY